MPVNQRGAGMAVVLDCLITAVIGDTVNHSLGNPIHFCRFHFRQAGDDFQGFGGNRHRVITHQITCAPWREHIKDVIGRGGKSL